MVFESACTVLPIAATKFALEQARLDSGRCFVILRRRRCIDQLSEMPQWPTSKSAGCSRPGLSASAGRLATWP